MCLRRPNAFFVVVVIFVLSVLTNEDYLPDSCSPPLLALINGSEIESREQQIQDDYTQVKEVKFSTTVDAQGEQRTCKIKCIAGQWVGPLCTDQQDEGRPNSEFKNCKLEQLNPNLIVSFRHVAIKSTGWSFPHGTRLHTRCREVGLYKLLGTPIPQCHNGAWTSRLPSCVPTTLLTNFTEDSPPSILIRIPSGSGSLEPGGELAIFPASTLHLECVFSRRLGSPDWTWTSPLGEYLTGWAVAPDERNWKYRLSLYNAKLQDSGTFTCATPRGITNSVTIQVVAVHCEPISVSGMHISVRVEGTRLGHKAIFQCPVGFEISGEANLTCQASGRWSAAVPKCQLIKCPPLDIPQALVEPHLRLDEHNNTYGGRAVFRCEWGYKLQGPSGLDCELTGKWSGALPKCIPIQCPAPILPSGGYLVQSESPGMDGGRYAVGSLVQFTCEGSHHLEGEPSIICTETGDWSNPPPLCTARCFYAGDPENGYTTPTKFTYDPGDLLEISCQPGLQVSTDVQPKCLPNGQWSTDLPRCTNSSVFIPEN